MGDAEDGGSEAESGEDSRRPGHRGFFGRIIGALSPSDIASGAQNGTDGTVLPASAAAPLPGIGNLRRMRVEDVMVPVAEVMAVPLDIRKEALVEVFSKSGLTRLPVYRETLDSPVGLVHLKDFALKHGFNGKGTRFALKGMLRPLLFVPPSLPLGVLLPKMQAERMHMALVIDEYGGVDGLVTIEDLIEQVVGEIEDEHDVAESATFLREKPGVYLAKATTDLAEFEVEIGLKLVAPED
jgi:magnesium and cobalt transporter